MKRFGLLGFLAAISAMIALAIAVIWATSSSWQPSIHYHVDGNLNWVLSSDGRIIVTAPPSDGNLEPEMAELTSRMSDDDFDWSEPLEFGGRRVVRGIARDGTPSRQLFDLFQGRRRTKTAAIPGMRHWMMALEDPHRRLAAHMMLSFAAVHWREANILPDSGRPFVYMPARSDGTPDLSGWTTRITRWHTELDQPIHVWHDGVLLAPWLVLPIVWMSRPRRRPGVSPTMTRWAFNGAALVCCLASLLLAGAWIRSYWVADEWEFPVVAAATPPMQPGGPSLPGTWSKRRWLGYSAGHVQFLERTGWDGATPGLQAVRSSFWIVSNPRTRSGPGGYGLAGGNWFTSSVNYFSTPAKVTIAARAQQATPPFVKRQVAAPVAPVVPLMVRAPPPLILSPAAVPLPPEMSARYDQANQDRDAASRELRKLELVPEAVDDGRRAAAQGAADAAELQLSNIIKEMQRYRNSPEGIAQAQAQLIANARALTAARAMMPVAVPGARTLVVSMWVLFLPLLVLPVIWIAAARRTSKRRLLHLCQVCGYDMRATPQRCPECGTAPSRSGA
ncbi:MAG TPA: hypothetical protein VH370_06260 [Humisphaera sp.]|jgi:rubrerythrin|nr:hypothetical protein [Humisphaera sp.]